MTDVDTPTRPVPVLRLFAITWAMATLFHVWVSQNSFRVLYSPDWKGIVHVGLTVAALVVLCRPRVLPLLGLAVLQIYSAWVEMPVLGNHWLLASIVALGLLLSVAAVRTLDPAEIARVFLPAGRVVLIVFYSFAALSKLNQGFFTPSGSCAPFYANESLSSLGLPTLGYSGLPPWGAILGTVAVECSIPVLLAFRRTRHAGVLAGLLFHSLLALDRTHLFTDFSAVLLALFLLFLPESFAGRLGERAWPKRAVAAFAVAALLVSLALWMWPVTWLKGAGQLLWVLYDVVVTGSVVAFLWRSRDRSATGLLRIRPLWLAVVPALALANGLTPYLELKTGFGWNMYSNLVTVAGHTNHLLIPRTWPVTDAQSHLVTVIGSDDPGLEGYAADRYRLALPQVQSYAAAHPGAWLRYELDGTVRTAPHIGSDPVLSRHVPVWRHKLEIFRAVDMRTPVRCQDLWGPAD